MKPADHIPYLATISDFYNKLRIGTPQGDDFAIMRIEDQPDTKLLNMPLFRGDFYRVVFLNNSKVDWDLIEEDFSATPQCIYFAYPGKLESWMAQENNSGYLVCFTEEFAKVDSLQSSFGSQFPFFDFAHGSLLPLEEIQKEKLTPILEEMLHEASTHHADSKDLIRLLLHQYLIQVRRIYNTYIETIPERTKNNVAVFNQFKKELDQYFIELAEGRSDIQASVSLIAERVNLNASYLNTIIKDVTGQTASTYVHDKTLLEAKSYLLHTDLQISEISHQLGFTNTSYFNRFFKRLTTQTPLNFRKNTI